MKIRRNFKIYEISRIRWYVERGRESKYIGIIKAIKLNQELYLRSLDMR